MSLRAGANHPTHLPFIKRPPKPLLLGYQGGDADDETTRRRGALDITTHFIRVAFRRVVPVQRQRVNTLPRAGACSGDRVNTLPGVHRITPSSGNRKLRQVIRRFGSVTVLRFRRSSGG